MSAEKYIGFTSLGELLWWINDIARADLTRCVMWWIAEGDLPYLVRATAVLTRNAEQGGGDQRGAVVQLKEPPRSENRSTLDQLWRYARPYKTRQTRSPSYWLFVIESMREETYRELSAHLKVNGELVICATSPIREAGADLSAERERFTAVRSSGVDADLLARRGLIGVTPIAVFEEGGVTLALSFGWSPPKLPERCWPADRSTILYRELSAQRHSLWKLEVEREGPSLIQLVRWVSPTAEAASGLVSEVSPELPRYKVQVKRRPPHRAIELSLGAHESQSFVFRLRSRADAFSATLVRVMNQLEGLRLPRVLYAAMDWDESYDGPERWHLLYVEHMSGDQLSAWRLLERFELNSRLGEVGLPNVYIDSSSQVSPPLEFLVDASSDESLHSLRSMLAMPSDDHITLVEATPESLTKPLIIQMKRSELRPLSELIVELTEGWNGAELKRATALSLAPEQLEHWRAETKRHLSDVVTLEHEALARANREALALLSAEGERVIEGMRIASVPVVEATELSQALTERIAAADQNYERVCESLAEVSRGLTAPRRSWVSEQTRRAGQALARSAPVLEDLSAARVVADNTTSDLNQRSETLRNASREVTRQRERWVEQQGLSEQVAAEARDQLSLLEEAARQATQRIKVARAATEKRQQEAQRVYEEVKEREAKLLKERRAVEALEAENTRIHQKNERDEAELTHRRALGETERARVIHRRDIELPKLRGEVASLEAEVRSLNPPKVDREFNEASAAKQRSERALRELQESMTETQRLIKEREREVREASELKEEHLREIERLRAEVVAARELATEVESLKRDRQQVERALKELNPSRLSRERSSLTTELSRVTTKVNQAHETQRLIAEGERELTALQPQLQRLQEMRARLDEQTKELDSKRRLALSDQALKQREELLKICLESMERKLTWRDKLILRIGKR